MIIRSTPNHIKLFFIMQGSIVPRVAPLIVLVSVFSLAVLLVDRFLVGLPHISVSVTSVFGIALSLFLGFRNNAAYERWWEARKLWGLLIADLRNLGRETVLFIDSENLQKRLLRTAIEFIHWHRINLRDEQEMPLEVLHRFYPEGHSDAQKTPHPACLAMDNANRIVTQAYKEKVLDGFGRKALAERLAALSTAQAGCERIKNTPLPFVYSLLVLRTTWLYCFAIPFALIDSAGFLTPLFAAVIAYVFFGLAEVTEELERPFSKKPYGLPLDAMCRTVEISLAPHLQINPPPPLRPQNSVLT